MQSGERECVRRLTTPNCPLRDDVAQRDHDAFVDGLGVADERFERGVGTLARFELRERGAVHAGQFGQIGQTEPALNGRCG